MAEHSYSGNPDEEFANSEAVTIDIFEEQEIPLRSSQATDEQLIDLVRSYKHLYDKSGNDYKDAQLKCDSWDEIAETLQATGVHPLFTGSACQKRWSYLRNKYGNEKRLRERDSKLTSGASKRTPFPYFDRMRFIDRFILPRSRRSHVAQSSHLVENIDSNSYSLLAALENRLIKDKPTVVQTAPVTTEQAFANLLAAELERLPNEEKTYKKQKIMELLYTPYQL